MTARRAANDAVILLAAGRGSRMEGAVGDKILAPVHGRPLFSYSLEAFAAAGSLGVFVVVHRDSAQRAALEEAVAAVAGADPRQMRWTRGGATRGESVCRGLEKVPDGTRTVFIHDCARPLVRPETIAELGRLAREDGAACLARRISDTVKRVPGAEGATRRLHLEDVERDRLWTAETPQAFECGRIRRAYEAVRKQGLPVTDDAGAVTLAGFPVTLLETPYPNPKLTRPGDLPVITCLLGERNPGRQPAGQAFRSRPPGRAGA